MLSAFFTEERGNDCRKLTESFTNESIFHTFGSTDRMQLDFYT